MKGPPWKMLDEDAYIEPEACSGELKLSGGRPFRGPECGIFPSIFLSTWETSPFSCSIFDSLSSNQRIFHAFAFLSLDV